MIIFVKLRVLLEKLTLVGILGVMKGVMNVNTKIINLLAKVVYLDTDIILTDVKNVKLNVVQIALIRFRYVINVKMVIIYLEQILAINVIRIVKLAKARDKMIAIYKPRKAKLLLMEKLMKTVFVVENI